MTLTVSTSGTDHYSFVSPHDPPRPHALSESGRWSHFASYDAVEASGGPRASAAQYAAPVCAAK
jgi:hypothetical protein